MNKETISDNISILDRFELTKIHSDFINPKPLLDMVVCVEAESELPIAIFLQTAFGKCIAANRVANREQYDGLDAFAEVDGHPVYVGSEDLMKQKNFEFDSTPENGQKLHVAWNGQYAGYIVVKEVLR